MNEKFNNSEKTGKQCRERWHNHLNPRLNKDSFNLEDEIKIFEYQRQMGNKWSEIAGFFPGRNDNFIKNCFYSAIRRNLRKYNKNKVPSKQLKGTINSLLKNSHAKKILLNFPEHQNLTLIKEKQNSLNEQQVFNIEKPVVIGCRSKKGKSEILTIQKEEEEPKPNFSGNAFKNTIFRPFIERNHMPLQVNTRFSKKAVLPPKEIDDITPILNYQVSLGMIAEDYEVLPELSSKNTSIPLSRGDSLINDTNTTAYNSFFPDYSPTKKLQFYSSPRNSH